MNKIKELLPPPIVQITQQTRTPDNEYLSYQLKEVFSVKLRIKRMSYVLLAVAWIPLKDVGSIAQAYDVHIHPTIIIGSNNVIVRE